MLQKQGEVWEGGMMDKRLGYDKEELVGSREDSTDGLWWSRTGQKNFRSPRGTNEHSVAQK